MGIYLREDKLNDIYGFVRINWNFKFLKINLTSFII